MAKKPGKKAGTGTADTSLVSLSDIKKIWTSLQAKDWLNIVTTAFPGNRWSQSRTLIKGRCPFHDDHDPSFMIDFERRQAKCYGCKAYYWDPIKFYKALNPSLSYIGALKELKTKYNLKVSTKTIDKISALFAHREMKQRIYTLLNGELCKAYLNPTDPELAYAQPLVDYLKRWRQVPLDLLHCYPIGVMPPEARLAHLAKTYAKDTDTPDMWEEIKTYLTYAFQGTEWLGSLAFFTGEAPGECKRIKLRRVPLVDRATQDFVKFDSTVRGFTYILDEHETGNGFFGLFGTPGYQPHFGKEETTSVYLVEGEFDALSVFARQFQSDVGFVVFSAGGSSVESVDALSEFGFKDVRIIGDRDEGGIKFIQAVLQKTTRLSSRIFQWPSTWTVTPADLVKINQKDADGSKLDLDMAVRCFGLPSVDSVLRDESNYLLTHKWALFYAEQAMSAVAGDDVRSLTNIAGDWGKYIHHGAELHAYVTTISQQFNLDPGLIAKSVIEDEEDEDMFIERIRCALMTYIHVVQKRTERNDHLLRVWDKTTHTYYDLLVNDAKRIGAFISSLRGKDTRRFIMEDVGEPAFLQTKDEGGQRYINSEKLYAEYVRVAVARLSSALPVSDKIHTLGPGFHVMPAPNSNEEAPRNKFVLINSASMYPCEFTDPDHPVWRESVGPSEGNVIIQAERDSSPRPAFASIRSLEDLNTRPTQSFSEMYHTLLDVVNTGWDFADQEVTTQLMAGILMTLPAADLFIRQPMLMVTAEKSSGKSTLVGGLIGKTHAPLIHIIENALYMQSFTVAGVRQAANNSQFVICLDEFEDRGINDKKSINVRGVLDLYRGTGSGESSVIRIGSANGMSVEVIVRSPLIVANIYPLRDSTDLSRFVVVKLINKHARESPTTSLLRKFGENFFTNIRRALPRILFQNAMHLQNAYARVRKLYINSVTALSNVLDRQREGMFPILAVMELAGIDHRAFVERYYTANRASFELVKSSSSSDDLFQSLLNTMSISVYNDTEKRTWNLNQLLTSNQAERINHSDSGCYYDHETGWLVVNWTAAAQQVLRNTPFQREGIHYFKQQAERIASHKTNAEVENSGILKRLVGHMGGLLRAERVTAFDVRSMLSEMGINLATETASPEAALLQKVNASEVGGDAGDFGGLSQGSNRQGNEI